MTESFHELSKRSKLDEEASKIMSKGSAKFRDAALDSENITEQNATNPHQVKDLNSEQAKIKEIADKMNKAAKDPQPLNKLKIIHEKLKIAHAKISTKIDQAHNKVDKKALEPIRQALGFMVKKINEFFNKIKNRVYHDKDLDIKLKSPFEGLDHQGRPKNMMRKSPMR